MALKEAEVAALAKGPAKWQQYRGWIFHLKRKERSTMADSTTGFPPFICRGLTIPEWNTYVANYDFGPVKPSILVLHHTYIPTESQWRGLTSLRGVQAYYGQLGWDAGPHLFVGPDAIWLATPMKDIGIHAGLGNSGYTGGKLWYSIGMEMVGNFDKVRPKGKVWENAKAVISGLSKRLGLAPRALIRFHRDYTNEKSCPGWAITKEWVYGEAEAPPSKEPQGPIGDPPPAKEALMTALLQQSYSQRSKGYSANWAFHVYAVKNNLGVPMANPKRVKVDGKEYSYQPFARDTLYCQVPNWGDVKSMYALTNGVIPPGGVGRVLLDATFKDCGAVFHPEWSFHQASVLYKVGPPLGEGGTIKVDGADYVYQTFAQDTLYSKVPNWADVKRLSQLFGATNPTAVKIRELLLGKNYEQFGGYHPEWAFHQIAPKLNLGSPLSVNLKVNISGTDYGIQIYALDTLYNVVPKWSEVKRLSDLMQGKTSTVLGGSGEAGEEDTAPISDLAESDAKWEPDPNEFKIQHSDLVALPVKRLGESVKLVVLHGDPGPAEATLERMFDLGSHESAHYYIKADGTICSLVDEQDGAWHAGFAKLKGKRVNVNRCSIGIVIEAKATKVEEDNASLNQEQKESLSWLLQRLAQKYQLTEEAFVRWLDLENRTYRHSLQRLDDLDLAKLLQPAAPAEAAAPLTPELVEQDLKPEFAEAAAPLTAELVEQAIAEEPVPKVTEAAAPELVEQAGKEPVKVTEAAGPIPIPAPAPAPAKPAEAAPATEPSES